MISIRKCLMKSSVSFFQGHGMNLNHVQISSINFFQGDAYKHIWLRAGDRNLNTFQSLPVWGWVLWPVGERSLKSWGTTKMQTMGQNYVQGTMIFPLVTWCYGFSPSIHTPAQLSHLCMSRVIGYTQWGIGRFRLYDCTGKALEQERQTLFSLLCTTIPILSKPSA